MPRHLHLQESVASLSLRSFLALALILLSGWLWLPPATAQTWRQYEDCESAGWSPEKLEAARKFASDAGSAAVFIVDHGQVVAAWGHVAHPFKSASIRKSLYDATMGAEHFVNPMDVNSTLADLEIDDLNPLTAREKAATLEQLMMARSGVYHPAAYETRSNAQRRPERGSAGPGEQWYYNNWDFNVLTVMFERLSGHSISESYVQRLVEPLEFDDFDERNIFDSLEPRSSRYPATTLRISARDLARVGKLYLQQGRWNDTQVVSKDWIKRSTQPATLFESGHYRGEGNGYGRLWWIFPSRTERNSPYQSVQRIVALGAGGQIMVLVPEWQVVVVHLADTDSRRGVGDQQGVQLMDLIFAARQGTPDRDAPLKEVQAENLDCPPPAPLAKLDPVSDTVLEILPGRYMFSEEQGIELYVFQQRLFARTLGLPYPDIELFLSADGKLRNPLVNVVFTPDGGLTNTPETISMRFQGRDMKATRTEDR